MATIFGTYSAPQAEKDEDTKVLRVKMTRKEARKDIEEEVVELGQDENYALVCMPVKFEAFDIENKRVSCSITEKEYKF